jgi:rhodanese-related sulfurtransferase
MSAAGADRGVAAGASPAEVPAHVPEVSHAELVAILRERRVPVLNVLAREAYAAGHIPGTTSLPVADIAERAPVLFPDRAQPLVVYCASASCSADRRGWAELTRLGYRDVRAYAPGFAGWVDAGGAVERGEPVVVRPISPGTPRPPHAARPRTARTPRIRDELLTVFDRIIDLPANALLGLWLVIIVGFGLVYWLPTLGGAVTLLNAGEPVRGTLDGLATAGYFSFVTGLSVGYGDVVPVGWMRLPAILEGAADLLLFGFVISKFMTARQDALLEELHRTAFEERLGRVRTNLHFVLSEFEAIGDACREAQLPAPRVLARLESAVLIFAGELRTIHDLLYQPEHRPEESMLEGLLASLAANLESLRDVLLCLPGERADMPVLVTQLAATTRLSEEICGECVPHEFAPSLRIWMDRIRDRARGLALATR